MLPTTGTPSGSMRRRLAALVAAGLSLAGIANAQADFAVTAGYESGKIAVRDATDASPLVMQRTLPLWDDNTGGQSVAPTIEFVPQQQGYDVVYTFTNNTSMPRKQGQIRVGVLTMGANVQYLDGGFRGCRTEETNQTDHKVKFRFYPHNMYSPAWIVTNDKYAVGVSIQYPVLEYQHDVRFAMRKTNGSTSTGEGGPGWWCEIRLSNNPTDSASTGLTYEAVIPPGQTRRYVVSVRVTDVPSEWIRVLAPYRDYFRATYGGVRYDRRSTPVNLTTVANSENITATNPYGWASQAQRDPDVFGWEKWVDDIASRTGWGGYMIFKPTGVFSRNRGLNFPFQFTTRWLANDNMRTALDSRVGFPALIRRTKKELGFWWGRSAQVMDGWDNGSVESLDPENPRHVELANNELALAVRAGATMVGLDTFSHLETPTWKLYDWLLYLKWRYPQVSFIIEPMPCDIMHSLAPAWLRAFGEENDPDDHDSLYRVNNPHYLADFILPGHEIWAGYRYLGLTRLDDGTELTAERVYSDMQRFADFGMVPAFFTNFPLNREIHIAQTAYDTVPADLQIPESQWKYRAGPTVIRTPTGHIDSIDDYTGNMNDLTQLPGSGMGETPGSRIPMGPMLESSGSGSMSMLSNDDGGGRGPIINHSDVAKALQRAALTRTGGVSVSTPQLPALIRTGNDRTALSESNKGITIFSGRPQKKSRIVIAGDE